jgi:hypothetical protein
VGTLQLRVAAEYKWRCTAPQCMVATSSCEKVKRPSASASASAAVMIA